MEHLLELVRDDWVFVSRIAMAMILGGIIGLERQSRGQPAGLRTNILVCLGSAAVIVAFQKLYATADPGAESAIRMDPARAAAGVITGIGFLGAGTIVKSENFVRGLTTAASIWVVSAVGVTVGLGEYIIAISVTLIVLLTLFLLHRLPISIDRYSVLSLRWKGDLSLLDDVSRRLDQSRVRVIHRAVTRKPGTGSCSATFTLRYRGEHRIEEVFDTLQADERLITVSVR